MNKDRLIELAKQAGWEYADDDRGFEPLWDFAELVRADERALAQPVQQPVDTLIAAWQALEETSGHVLDAGDAEGRMHMSVIRSAWEQMDSLVREMWDERGRP